LRITSDAGESLLVKPSNGLVTTAAALNPSGPNVVGSADANSIQGPSAPVCSPSTRRPTNTFNGDPTSA
jgi:hypothetical protein